MKRTLYYIAYLLLAVLLPASCSEEVVPKKEPASGKVTWRFSVLMPETQHTTRAFGESAGFRDLHLAVFSQVGNVWFLEEVAEATAPKTTGTDQNGDQLTEFSVTLNESSAPRRIHLIGNYPGLSLPFGDEATLIGLLSVEGEHDVYWGCVDVDKIEKIENGNIPDKMKRIPLVRNFAKVQLQIKGEAKNNFQLTGYALHNVPDKGTVAPYNNKTRKFAQFVESDNVCKSYIDIFEGQGYEGNEPYDMLPTPITDDGPFHAPASGDASQTVAPFYIYERKNRGVANPTSVIVKGKYKGEDLETYYKLDIIYHDDNSNTNVYYNLLRNFIYTINIEEVKGGGYATLDEALRNPASNNISGSTEVNDYTNISDGVGRLFVSTTYMVLTSDNPVDIYYQYRPNIKKDPEEYDNTPKNGTNGEVSITAPEGDVLSSATVAKDDEDQDNKTHANWRKITLQPKTPTGIAKEQKITVAAGGLQREITLVLRQPYAMTVKIDPKTKEVPKVNGMFVKVWTSIPSGLSPNLFPLLFTYSTAANTLYPLAGSGMYATTGNGTYGFVYELGHEEYSALQPDPNDAAKVMFDCTLQTNCTNSATSVYVDNPYFDRGADNFTNNSITSVPNVNVQRIGGRYPKTLNDTGASTVDVLYEKEKIGTVTISGSKVVATDYVIPQGAQNNDDLTFTFNDNYYWLGTWHGSTTYTATCTVGALNENGTTTLNFQTPFSKTIEIPVGTNVTVPTQHISYNYNRYETDVYPQHLQESESQEVDVTLNIDGNDIEIGTITINRTQVTSGLVVVVPDGVDVDSDDTLTFSFKDNYCTDATYRMGSWTYNWSGEEQTYEGKCNVSDIGTNGFKITFKRLEL